MMARQWIAVGIVVALFSAVGVNTAQACSGPPYRPPSLETLIERSTVIVEATIVETDDLGQNAVLVAHRYLSGRGGQFLLLYRTPVRLSAASDRGLNTGCSFLEDALERSASGVFFLRRRPDGIYQYTTDQWGFISLPPDTTYEAAIRRNPLSNDRGGNVNDVSMTYEQIVNFVMGRSGQSLTTPIANEYPVLTPLQLTTLTNNQYIIALDGESAAVPTAPRTIFEFWSLTSQEFECRRLSCVIVSPDQSLFGVQANENTILLTNPYDTGRVIELIGQAFLFTPTGDSIAVWNDNALHVFAINGGYRDMYLDNEFERQARFTNHNRNQLYFRQAIWSDDGTALAFVDDDGLWLWDVITFGAYPELIAPHYDWRQYWQPIAFSPSGRYLMYSRGSLSYVYDRFSGETQLHSGQGIFAPDERSFLVTEPSFTYENDNGEITYSDGRVAVCNLPFSTFTYLRCNPPGVMFSIAGMLVEPVEVVALEDDQLLVMYCDVSNPLYCSLARTTQYGSVQEFGDPVIDFAYEPEQGALAVLNNPYTITINDQVYDLRGQVDSEIISIEWQPSLFYRRDR
jgi:hypothetical protein